MTGKIEPQLQSKTKDAKGYGSYKGRMFTAYVSHDDYDWLKEEALSARESISQVVRRAIAGAREKAAKSHFVSNTGHW